MTFNTLMKKTIKINMCVLVTFVQSTSKMQNQVFRSISFLFDTLILASLARDRSNRKGGGGGGGGRGEGGGLICVGPNMHGIQL